MAAGLLNQYSAAQDSTFQDRCIISALAAAVAISSESVNVANHANRVVLAKAVANAPTLWGPIFAYALATQAIDTNSTDTAINNGVSSVWNTVSGTP